MSLQLLLERLDRTRFEPIVALARPSAEVLAYHRACLERRVAGRRRPIDYQTIVDDIFSIGRGCLVMD